MGCFLFGGVVNGKKVIRDVHVPNFIKKALPQRGHILIFGFLSRIATFSRDRFLSKIAFFFIRFVHLPVYLKQQTCKITFSAGAENLKNVSSIFARLPENVTLLLNVQKLRKMYITFWHPGPHKGVGILISRSTWKRQAAGHAKKSLPVEGHPLFSLAKDQTCFKRQNFGIANVPSTS